MVDEDNHPWHRFYAHSQGLHRAVVRARALNIIQLKVDPQTHFWYNLLYKCPFEREQLRFCRFFAPDSAAVESGPAHANRRFPAPPGPALRARI